MQHTYTALFPFCGLGAGARGFLDATLPLSPAVFRCLGGIDVDADACTDFETLTGTKALRADIAALTVDQLRTYAGDVAPDVVFCSPPCKGASGLLSGEKAATAHYAALNKLAVVWTKLMLAAWVTPPRLVLLENVPGLTKRAPETVKEVRRLLRSAGYVVHEGFHDCGVIGGLAQHRRRYLLVARHAARVPGLLYKPPTKRVRGCGEVLGALPLPGDPRAGVMHRLPRISWLNWVRLALIPPGGDWRDLPTPERLAAMRGQQHFGKYIVLGWDDAAKTVTGSTRVGSGAESIADPRLSRKAFSDVLVMHAWDDAARAVTGGMNPGGGGQSVADPRLISGAFRGTYGVLDWTTPVGAVTGRAGESTGAFSGADPRVLRTPYPHTYGVLGWTMPAHAVTSYLSPGTGPASVADPRLTCAPRERSAAYGVLPWPAPSGAVVGSACVDNGRWSVADGRLGPTEGASWFKGKHGVMDWGQPGRTVIGGPSNGADAVADPRVPGNPPLAVWFSCRDPKRPPPYIPVLPTVDGTWHRPLTTLELAALQGIPTTIDGQPLVLAGRDVAGWRERIGNAVPVQTAEAIAQQMLLTLVGADAGRWALSSDGAVWVQPEAVQ